MKKIAVFAATVLIGAVLLLSCSGGSDSEDDKNQTPVDGGGKSRHNLI